MIEAWRLVRRAHPDVQLALVGSMAHDDPEGWEYYNRTVAAAGGDPDIFILSNLNNVGSVEVNAFQVHSAAVLAEVDPRGVRAHRHRGALEGATVVAGRVGGIVDQVAGRRDGLPRGLGGGVRREDGARPDRPGGEP